MPRVAGCSSFRGGVRVASVAMRPLREHGTGWLTGDVDFILDACHNEWECNWVRLCTHRHILWHVAKRGDCNGHDDHG